MLLIVVLVRVFRRKLPGLMARAKRGGAILARPREYMVRVVLPSFGAWLAKLGVIAVFLAGYGITVTFHTVMSVMGGNSIANMVSVTPGGVGVNQATNVAALDNITDAATATAYSLGQQLADHGLEHRLRRRARGLGIRLGRRQGARRAVLRRRQGQGRGAEGAARRSPRGKELERRWAPFPPPPPSVAGRTYAPTRKAEERRACPRSTLQGGLAGSPEILDDDVCEVEGVPDAGRRSGAAQARCAAALRVNG